MRHLVPGGSNHEHFGGSAGSAGMTTAIMATRVPASSRPPAGRLAQAMATLRAAMVRFGVVIIAASLIGVAAALVLALLSYSPLDPSFNTVTGRTTTNWMGPVGAHVADLLLQILGWPALVLALPFAIAGVRVAQGRDYRLRRAAWAVPFGGALLAAAGGAIPLGGLTAPAGFGGVIGVGAGNLMLRLGEIDALANLPLGLISAVLLVPAGLGLVLWGAGLEWRDAAGAAGIGGGIGSLWPRRIDADEAPQFAAPFATPQSTSLSTPRVRERAIDAPDVAPAAPRTVVVESPRGAAPGKRQQKERQPALDLGDSAIWVVLLMGERR